jgi:hypothetical protein
MRTLVPFLLSVVLFAGACKRYGQPQIPTDQNGNEDFAEFLGNFLTDTAFQFSRVAFPIEYEAGNFDSLYQKGDKVVLTRQNWPVQIPPPENSNEVRQELKRVGDLVIERLIVLNTYYTERRYLLREGKWYLIYYSGLQGDI